MNLKKDEKLWVRRSGTVSKLCYWPEPNHTHSAIFFPPPFCSRALQYRIQAAVQLCSNCSNNIPPWAETIICLSNNISKNPCLPTPSIFPPCCHHGIKQSYSGKTKQAAIRLSLPLCSAAQTHFLWALPPSLPWFPYPSQILCCPKGELIDPEMPFARGDLYLLIFVI